jgi:ABC-2 type transport system ATP-binding protein
VRWRGPDRPESQATDTPTALVAELATRFGGEVPELTIVRPTLEDIYLKMIGEETR